MAGIARKVGSKDSRFSHFPIFSYIGTRFGRETEGSSRSSSRPSRLKEKGGGRRKDEIPFSDRAETKSSDDSLDFETNSSRIWISDATRTMGKLEDLVRLALKRLNVSYLTILSRLVWYETRNVCVS